MFESEKRKLGVALGTVVGVYALILLVLWGRLWSDWSEFMYVVHSHFDEVTGYTVIDSKQSFLSWLFPWMVTLGLLALVVLAVWVLLIWANWHGKHLCVDCLKNQEHTYTHNFVAFEGTPPAGAPQGEYVCVFHVNYRRDQAEKAEAEARCAAEGRFTCPGCLARDSVEMEMTKTPVKVNGVYILIDDCPRCGGRFIDKEEQALLDEQAQQREQAAYNRGESAGSSRGTMTGIAVGIAIS